MTTRTHGPILDRIVDASVMPRKFVRCAADTGVPIEFFDSEDQGLAAYKRFAKQRSHARERGIAWELSFAQWWGIWRASGLWAERGCSHSYAAVMARDGDQGPYSVNNVRITTLFENFAESRAVHAGLPSKPRKKAKRAPVIAGSGRGWTFISSARKKPYMVKVAGKYVGSFATQAEAEAAYKCAAAIYLETAWPVDEARPKVKTLKPVSERMGSIYLKDVQAGLTNTEIAKKYGKASRSSIRMALKSAGLPTCFRNLREVA